MAYPKSLKLALSKLSGQINRHVLKAKKENRLTIVPYQFIPVKKINYENEWYYLDWKKIRYFDFYNFGSREGFTSFVNLEIATLKDYEIAAEELAAFFGYPLKGAKQALSHFINPLISELPNNNYNPTTLIRFIESFIRSCELEKSQNQINWNVTIGLRDIFIASKEIEIFPGKKLRRITKEQLQVTEPVRRIDERSQMFATKLPLTSTFLSFQIVANQYGGFGQHDESIYREMELWVNVLQLFKPGSVNIGSEYIVPDYLFDHPYQNYRDSTFDKSWIGKVDYSNTTNFKQWIRKGEEKKLVSFAKKMEPILKNLSHRAYLVGSPIDLALHRYKDALVKSEVSAYRILSSITSLESLLSDGQSEINYKIKVRLAGLLSHFNFDGKDIMLNLGKAYDLRSKLVHGSALKQALLAFATENAKHIINYNRICLIVYLQLKDKFNKEDFISIIDESLVNSSKRSELNRIIKDNIFIPLINPYPKRKET